MRSIVGPSQRVVVVGAGLAGLSTALRLTGTGREVVVVERRTEPGGSAGQLRLGGYTFDTGPTVLTMPELIADFLACVGERIDDHLELTPLSPVYRAFFADGATLDVDTDIDRTAAAIGTLAGQRDADGYRDLVAWLQRLHGILWHDFIDRNFDRPTDLLRPALARLAAMGGFRSLDALVRRHIRDSRVRRLFTFQSLYAGMSPHAARAVYGVIAYLDTVRGTVYPRGGVHALPQALASVATKHGVEFRYDTTVSGFEFDGDRATAVRTSDGDRIAADAVVLAGDLPSAYHMLLPTQPRRRIRSGPSCVVLHVGSRASYPQLAHHNIHFGTAWRQTFHEITRDGSLMTDPSLLVTHPTPHTYYVLAPTPNLRSPIDWSRIAGRYRDELVGTLESRGYKGFDSSIEVEHMVTPADWAADGHTDGTPFAAAHTFLQTGPFRPTNLVRGLDNVVFAGAWTTPGVGVPMALLSGRLAAERITGNR